LELEHPFIFANWLFLVNVDVLFWIISLLQGSTWVSQQTNTRDQTVWNDGKRAFLGIFSCL
jgi:hypothetical protein